MTDLSRYFRLFVLMTATALNAGPIFSGSQAADIVSVPLEAKLLPNSGPLHGLTNVFFAEPGTAPILYPESWKEVRMAKIIESPAFRPVAALRYKDETGELCYAVDTDADFDWRDEKPLAFEKVDDSLFADVVIQVVRADGRGPAASPVAYQIVRNGNYIYARVREYRTGMLRMGNQALDVLLRAKSRNHPLFGLDQSLFFADLDGDGKIVQAWEQRKTGEIAASECVPLTQPFLAAGRKLAAESLDAAGTRLVFRPTAVDTAASPGFLAPPVSGLDLAGRPRNLRETRGRVVLLEFWSVDCPWGDSVRPLLNDLAKKFEGPDFVELSIAREKDAEVVREYLKNKPKLSTVLFRGDESWTTYNPEGATPLCYVIGRDGIIKLVALGATSLKALDKIVAGLLSSK